MREARDGLEMWRREWLFYNKKLPGRRKRGRRLVDVVEEDMQGLGVTEEDIKDRLRWRQIICGDP